MSNKTLINFFNQISHKLQTMLTINIWYTIFRNDDPENVYYLLTMDNAIIASSTLQMRLRIGYDVFSDHEWMPHLGNTCKAERMVADPNKLHNCLQPSRYKSSPYYGKHNNRSKTPAGRERPARHRVVLGRIIWRCPQDRIPSSIVQLIKLRRSPKLS